MLREPYPALTWHIRSDDRREFWACFRGRDISEREWREKKKKEKIQEAVREKEKRGEDSRGKGGTLGSIYGTDISGSS